MVENIPQNSSSALPVEFASRNHSFRYPSPTKKSASLWSTNTESQAWLLDRSLLDIMLQDAPFHIVDKKGVLLVRPHMEQIVENRLNCERGKWSRGRSTREKTHACCARGTSCCKPFLTSTQKRAFTR